MGRYSTLDSTYGPLIPNVNLWVVYMGTYEKFNAVWRDRTYQIDMQAAFSSFALFKATLIFPKCSFRHQYPMLLFGVCEMWHADKCNLSKFFTVPVTFVKMLIKTTQAVHKTLKTALYGVVRRPAQCGNSSDRWLRHAHSFKLQYETGSRCLPLPPVAPFTNMDQL